MMGRECNKGGEGRSSGRHTDSGIVGEHQQRWRNSPLGEEAQMELKGRDKLDRPLRGRIDPWTSELCWESCY